SGFQHLTLFEIERKTLRQTIRAESEPPPQQPPRDLQDLAQVRRDRLRARTRGLKLTVGRTRRGQRLSRLLQERPYERRQKQDVKLCGDPRFTQSDQLEAAERVFPGSEDQFHLPPPRV